MTEPESERAGLARARARTLAALEVLRVEGRLAAPDFERLGERARRAGSVGELEALLPTLPEERPPTRVAPEDVEPERDTLLAVLTGARRSGVWEPPETLRVVSVMGGVDLDFRQAEFLEGVTEVLVTAVMGGVNVVAPPGVDVESDGFALMGEFRHLRHRSPHPDSPVLRIRGFALMGGVEVKIKA
jgi:hypothetical protein